MQSAFATGDLVGGITAGVHQLAEHARRPQLRHSSSPSHPADARRAAPPGVRPFVVPDGSGVRVLRRRARGRCRRGPPGRTASRPGSPCDVREPGVDPVEGRPAGQRPREHVLQHRASRSGCPVLPDRCPRRRGTARGTARAPPPARSSRRRRRCCAGSRSTRRRAAPRPATPASLVSRRGQHGAGGGRPLLPGDRVVALELLGDPAPRRRGRRAASAVSSAQRRSGATRQAVERRRSPSSRPCEQVEPLGAAGRAAVRRRRDALAGRCRRTPEEGQLVVAARGRVLEQLDGGPCSQVARRAARLAGWRELVDGDLHVDRQLLHGGLVGLVAEPARARSSTKSPAGSSASRVMSHSAPQHSGPRRASRRSGGATRSTVASERSSKRILA